MLGEQNESLLCIKAALVPCSSFSGGETVRSNCCGAQVPGGASSSYFPPENALWLQQWKHGENIIDTVCLHQTSEANESMRAERISSFWEIWRDKQLKGVVIKPHHILSSSTSRCKGQGQQRALLNWGASFGLRPTWLKRPSASPGISISYFISLPPPGGSATCVAVPAASLFTLQSARRSWKTLLSTAANSVKISGGGDDEGGGINQRGRWRTTSAASWLRSMYTRTYECRHNSSTYIYWVWRLFLLFRIGCGTWTGAAARRFVCQHLLAVMCVSSAEVTSGGFSTALQEDDRGTSRDRLTSGNLRFRLYPKLSFRANPTQLKTKIPNAEWVFNPFTESWKLQSI